MTTKAELVEDEEGEAQMMDAETKKRIGEIEVSIKSDQILTNSDVWVISIGVVVITLCVIGFLVFVFWDQICLKIALDTLKPVFGPLPPPR